MESRSIDVDGIRMRWEERGEGQPVVFLHGIPTGPGLWRHVVPRVENARSLAWEMVGYGQSIPEGRGRDISVGRQAEYLIAWLGSLGIDRAVLVGHDLGGGVAQIAAVRNPELCAGLVLTNAIGYDSWPIPAVKAMRSMGAIVRRLPPSMIKLSIRALIHLGHDDPRVASESLNVHWPNYAEHDAAGAFIRQVRSLNVHDTLAVKDALPRLKGTPARVVWGAADQFQKVRYGQYFAGDLGTTVQRIEGGKHFTPEDHPDVLAEAVNGLLTEISH